MLARDLDTLMRLDDQILGVIGDDLLLPEAGERDLRRLISRALRTQDAEDFRLVFECCWRDARIRRQPWERGIRSYVGWRLHGSIERLAAASLATEIAGDEIVGLALGRDESGLWIPERALRGMAFDLELDPQGGSPLLELAGLPPCGSSASYLRELLTTICGQAPTTVLIESPAYWSLVPGWMLPDANGPHLHLLTDAYCGRPTTTTTRLASAGCPLGDPQTLVPPRSEWDAIPEVRLAADSFDALADLDDLAEIVRAIPPAYRTVLLTGTRQRPLADAMRGLLTALVGRHLLSGVFTIPEVHTVSFLQRPIPPFEQAAVTSLPDSRLAISAGIIPAALTWCGLLPESLGAGIGGHTTTSYSWATVTGCMGMGDLLAAAWPDRVTFTADDGFPYPGEWLVLPTHHAEVLAETLRRADDLNRMEMMESPQ